jgi:hypothetical protein
MRTRRRSEKDHKISLMKIKLEMTLKKRTTKLKWERWQMSH